MNIYDVTGTKLKYKPGIVMGGKSLVHDCGVSRSIGYFMEPLLLLGLFSKKPLTIRLKGAPFCCFETIWLMGFFFFFSLWFFVFLFLLNMEFVLAILCYKRLILL